MKADAFPADWVERIVAHLEKHLKDGGMDVAYDFSVPKNRTGTTIQTPDTYDYLYDFYGGLLPWRPTVRLPVLKLLLAEHKELLDHWSILFDFDLATDIAECIKADEKEFTALQR